MSEDKRKRSPNWLPSEKNLLLDLVQLHYDVIENKQLDTKTIRTKLAEWRIIADEYNSRTNHYPRNGANLKAQWESMKKMARKEAANIRKSVIIKTESDDESTPPPVTKEDPFHQRILSLLSNSPAPLSPSHRIDNNEKLPSYKMTKGVFRRVPTHTNISSLERLHRKEIEAIELKKRLTIEEMQRSKVLQDLDIQIKKEQLRQEKIKTHLLLIRRRKILAFKQRKE